MTNGRTDMSYNISQVPRSNVDKIVPKSLEERMGELKEHSPGSSKSKKVISQGRGDTEGILLSTNDPGILSTPEISDEEYNFGHLNQTLDVFTYDSHYSSIHSLMNK